MAYDNADRLIALVDAGTNGGTAWTRPSTVPASSATLLVTNYAYNAAGWVQDVTDPQGIDTRTLYDNLGRTTKTIQDYTGGTPGNENDVATEYGYDGNNNVTYVQVDEPGGSYQKTAYVYGATMSGGSGVNSNDILVDIQHPDPSTGQPSSSQQDSYLVNALGQVVQYTDRNGNVHQYSYDVLGRLTSDAVTTLGTGVDGTIRQITYAYDSQGNLSLVTSYNAASGGTIVNQVQRVFNGLGQLTGEYQSHSGAVNTTSTPEVQYAYTEMSGGQNNSRLISMTYPSGYVLNYNYNTGLDSNISRLSSISDSTGVLESYKYLGLDTAVERDHPQINVNQTYISQNGQTGDAGDQYVGLDRFGRVVDQNWYNTTTKTSTDNFQYGYNQDGDVLYRQNLADAAMSELYQYDNLHQLISFARGTLNSTDNGIVGTPSASQSWSPDALGNFTSVATNGTAQTRTANQQNEYTSISGSGTITYDANGNITADGSGNTYVYDAWNHLISVRNNGTTLASYSYDGLGRRITETHGSTTTDLYLSSADQVLEEDIGGVAQARNVWSPVYVNALVLRDQSSQHNGVLDQRLYVQQDANWNVTALVDTSGNVVERYAYSPYGAVMVLNPDFSVRGASNYNVPNLWQGMGYDSAVNLYFTSSGRVISPTLMRPLQADPLGLGPDNNYYRWEGNGPTDTVDPSGLLDWWEFAKGFVAGGGQGVIDFFGGIWNILWHPIDTLSGVYNGITTLVGHLWNFEWDDAAKQLFPELYQLVTQWNTLSDYDKGHLIGKVVGQYGAGIATGAGVAKILKQLRGLKGAKRPVQPKSCFPAGTPVATSEGLRPIETIGVGDLVWAYDLVASQWRLCRVKRPYNLAYKGTFVYTTVAGETIASTYRHPYWVVRGEDLSSRPWLEHLAFIPKEATTPGRWVDSCDLRVGDEVLLRDGRVVPVERVEFGPFEGTVYNMEVEEFQCYTVGQNSVLVHNNNSPQTGPGGEGAPKRRGGKKEFKSSKQRKQLEGLKNSLKRQLRGKQLEYFKEAIEGAKIGEQFLEKQQLLEIFEEAKKICPQ